MYTWSWMGGEILGFDFETTGIDRFDDVPVSYALVTMLHGEVVQCESALVDPGRDIPEGATNVHGISTERARAEGMALDDAISYVSERILDASRRRVPVAGMKLDYDLTILDTQARRLHGAGLIEQGWTGPVLDAVVLDRHLDRFRPGRRTLGALCELYGVDIGHAHDATADAVASVRVLLALAAKFKAVREPGLAKLYEAQALWHRSWARGYDRWRRGQGMDPIDPRDYIWPVAPLIAPAA